MNIKSVVADVDYWIRNNCATWSTEAVIAGLIALGYMNKDKEEIDRLENVIKSAINYIDTGEF